MSDDQRLEPVARADLLVEVAYRRLRDAILSNQLPPGTSLSVPEFARRFEMSRSPIREAVQRLVFEGLAINLAHRGAEVAGVQLEDYLQLHVVREVLEGLAAQLATDHIDATGLDGLRRVLEAHEDVVESGDERRHIELDMAYHRAIREASGNDYLNVTLNRLQGKSHMGMFHLWRGPGGRRLALEEHKRIYVAIASGDSSRAAAAARDHIAQLRLRLTQYGYRDSRCPAGRNETNIPAQAPPTAAGADEYVLRPEGAAEAGDDVPSSRLLAQGGSRP